MFKIDKLNVKIKDNNKEILKDFYLTINDGEIHAIMGPNGVGKSTLSKVIMHHPDYVIESGSITYNDKVLNDLTTDAIARLGIYLLMQDPSIIDGVSNSEALRTALTLIFYSESLVTPIYLNSICYFYSLSSIFHSLYIFKFK